MPIFIVILEGRNIRVKSDDSAVVGFYTTRKVRAKNKDEAFALAKQMVMETWKKDGYQKINTGEMPQLRIDKVFEISFLQSLLRKYPTRGYTFYCEE